MRRDRNEDSQASSIDENQILNKQAGGHALDNETTEEFKTEEFLNS